MCSVFVSNGEGDGGGGGFFIKSCRTQLGEITNKVYMYAYLSPAIGLSLHAKVSFFNMWSLILQVMHISINQSINQSF